jgi:benzoyl-CoA reductase/2-hydroxyglutaryl-CoA dehydratase subunit BcrC/BadD/HgdB
VRRRLHDLRGHRIAGRLRGSEALTVIGATQTLDPATAAPLLDALLAALAARPAHQGRRLFLTGSAHDHPGYYAQIEAAGFLIVSEDHDWGDRSYEALVDEGAPDIADAIVDRYQSGTPASAKFAIATRAAYTARRAAESEVDLILALVRRDDPAPRWDIPDQHATAPVPLILLDDLPYDATGYPIADLISTHLKDIAI